MKKLNVSALIIFFLFSVLNLFPQGSKFEGKVKISVTDKKGTTEMTLFVKGNKSKIEMEDEQKVDIIFDSKEQKMITVIKEANMYMEMPLKTNLEQSNKSTDDQNYKRTGNKKKILGYDCEEVHFKNNKEDIEMWVSQENIPFMGIGGNGMPGQEQKSSFSSLSNLKMGFPFLIIAKSNGSTSRFEVTSIEKKSLDNSMFTIPSGFQKMDMNMMKQMK